MTRKFLRFVVTSVVYTAALLILAGGARAGTAEKVIYSFPYPGTNGLYPKARVLYAPGRLYGTTSVGGTGPCFNGNGCGVVFALTANQGGAWTYHQIYAFQGGADAQTPLGDIVRDSAGNLYGATEYGGANALGAVYKLSPGAGGKWTETIIHSFGSALDGASPFAGLTIDAAGNLYGTTSQGGTGQFGIVYQLRPNSDGTWSEAILHNFGGSPDGSGPAAEVIFDGAGNMYSTTVTGGSSNIFGAGVVFELSPDSGGAWTESILYTFPNLGIGNPVAPVYMDSAGILYGTGKSDGESGSAYELTPLSESSWTETTLIAFGHNGRHGATPYGGVAPDGKGNLYGTTFYGGNGAGVIFKLTPAGNGQWTESVAHIFSGSGDGAYCEAGLTVGEPGTFYGTTDAGGTGSYGTVFEFKPY